MKRQFLGLTATMLILCLALSACGASQPVGVTEPGTTENSAGPNKDNSGTAQTEQKPSVNLQSINAKAAAPIISGTKTYSNNKFSLELPDGWQIATVDEYATFSFYAYDPAKQERKIFFFCKLEPFHKTDAAKTEHQQLAAIVGPNDPYGYHAFSVMPTLSPATGAQMYFRSEYPFEALASFTPNMNFLFKYAKANKIKNSLRS